MTVEIDPDIEARFRLHAEDRIWDYLTHPALFDYSIKEMMIAAYRQGVMDGAQVGPRLEAYASGSG